MMINIMSPVVSNSLMQNKMTITRVTNLNAGWKLKKNEFLVRAQKQVMEFRKTVVSPLCLHIKILLNLVEQTRYGLVIRFSKFCWYSYY